MVTGAKGHGGTPHPMELTRPGWFAFQLSSTLTGVSNSWTKGKLISTQHTIRGGARVTAVHHLSHGIKKREDVFLKPLQAWDYCVFLVCDETNRYTPGGVCPTVPSADRSAQVIQTGSILGYSHRKPQCQRWSCRAQFYSGGWSWQGFLDRSSWPLHTERHTQGDRYTEMETKHVLFGKHQGGSFLSPLHFWSVSISNINANGFMHLGQPWALGMSTNLHKFRLNLRSL